MKYLFIPNFMNNGGSTLTCYQLAKNLEGPKVFFGCVRGDEYEQKFNDIGAIQLLPQTPQFDYDERLDRFINEYKPDVIHVFLPGHENPKYLERLPKECVKICTVLCCQKVGFNPELFDQVTFLSEYNKNFSNHVKNSCVIRPAMDIEENLVEENGQNEEIVFGRISAFCPSKLVHETLECAKLIDNHFIVAGEVQDVGYYEKCLRIAQETKNITLIPNLKEKDKKVVYKSIDVLHYPTSNESFCFSLLEGMKYGRAILTYNNSAIPELNPSNMVNNFDELKNQTIKLAQNKKLVNELGKENLEKSKTYSSANYAKEMMELYQKIYDEKRKSNSDN